LCGETIAGEKMKSNTGWEDNGNGTNSSAFAGLPGGYRGTIGDFSSIGSFGYWWSSSENNTDFAWFRSLYGNSGNVGRSGLDKQNGFSVRCLRD
jgi:uncharacterized protein (TIGR02145 family)